MFDNLVNQEAGNLIKDDIKKSAFPGAVLYSGSEASGKLTAALETARILSCKSPVAGKWQCTCESCMRYKSLISTNLLLMGPRDCSLEIQAAKDTFLRSYKENAPYIDATRYLFLRSIRKLTLRFSGILLQGDSSLSKIGTLIEDINEDLEELDFPAAIPSDFSALETMCTRMAEKCVKLETDYLNNSIPINQVRNMEAWAHLKTDERCKIVIIENADRMLASVRNALLKILEEPPKDCLFILLSSKRNAIMPTILSRVRTYNFRQRSLVQQADVITRVFHKENFGGSIDEYLLTFLPVKPDEIKKQAEIFFGSIAQSQIPDIADIVKKCDSFTPRIELKIFLNHFTKMYSDLLFDAAGSEFSAKAMQLLRNCMDNISLYNQTPLAALEILLKELFVLNTQFNKIMDKIRRSA